MFKRLKNGAIFISDGTDMSNYSELQCVAGEYISPAATSVPSLEPVPALPVEFNTRPTFGCCAAFFLFFNFCQSSQNSQHLLIDQYMPFIYVAISRYLG